MESAVEEADPVAAKRRKADLKCKRPRVDEEDEKKALRDAIEAAEKAREEREDRLTVVLKYLADNLERVTDSLKVPFHKGKPRIFGLDMLNHEN
ncbi:hypothetical protein E2562_031426 [Oryza meyeriana var. granulata]|uniref:Uncharacterized protein n=1 Tax=Oryza meyeriana var. granulata TaxID=110450 RepID=A0A6G1C1K1_9ORYZ|nr:hypothetical protein E2562_031426 [Oryza meyeriana var. granulata]